MQYNYFLNEIRKEAGSPTRCYQTLIEHRINRSALLPRTQGCAVFSLLRYLLKLKKIPKLEEKVVIAYLDILGRTPDIVGLAHYSKFLKERNIWRFVTELYFSHEHKAQVNSSSLFARIIWNWQMFLFSKFKFLFN